MGHLKKIAIVDDTAMWRDIISDIILIKKKRFDVVLIAWNGQDFISKMERLDDGSKPDIVILDINMPVMNGFETAEWLAIHYPAIRVFACSTNNEKATIQRLADLNAGFIYKGATARELVNVFKLC